MLRASLLFAASLQALHRQRGISPEVCRRILAWHTACSQAASAPPARLAAARRRLASHATLGSRELGVAAPDAAASQPAVPLCERPAQHAVPLPELLAWREAAAAQVEAVGDSWVQEQPDGPTPEDLQTELGWLLDDALAATAQQPGGSWRPAIWQQLERELRAGGALADPAARQRCMVQLREPLEWLAALWERRLRERVPLQYLTACAFWRDVVLSVGPGVLIPRPETELMIDFVQEAVAADPALAAGAWADLGTGSGALAVGVARALPQAERVYAVDLSPVPLAYAAFNAQRLGVGGRLTALQGSWYEPLQAAGVRRLAGVVSNPPYIPATDMPGLQAEVGRHEPHLALCGGEGLGVDALLPICTGAARLLQPGGFLALETAGGEQAQYIADVLRHMRRGPLLSLSMSALSSWGGSSGSSGGGEGSWESAGEAGDDERPAFADVRVRRDLRGVDRFVTANATQ